MDVYDCAESQAVAGRMPALSGEHTYNCGLYKLYLCHFSSESKI